MMTAFPMIGESRVSTGRIVWKSGGACSSQTSAITPRLSDKASDHKMARGEHMEETDKSEDRSV
jgi:hypothetical protein